MSYVQVTVRLRCGPLVELVELVELVDSDRGLAAENIRSSPRLVQATIALADQESEL